MANNEQINSLINMLSVRLNADSSQVREALEKGNLDKVLQNMNPAQAEKIGAILSDPEESKKVLSTPQAQALIKKLMG
ncbi:MAG: hypothetical protein IJO20_02460 [Ruminococcus sp.]|nr:hypothetical protein [Ruminococcus sp.]MBQ7133334.1 hypothetical protein [Ruminococcus sp.]